MAILSRGGYSEGVSGGEAVCTCLQIRPLEMFSVGYP